MKFKDKLILYIVLILILATFSSAEILVTNFADDTVSMIADNKELKILDAGDGPNKIAISENKAVISNTKGDSITIIDLYTKEVIATLPVGKSPIGLTISRDIIYVANSGSNSVSVIDLKELELIKTIKVDEIPIDVAVKEDTLFVSNLGSETISVVDLKIGSVIKEIKDSRRVGSPAELELTANNKYLYVLNTKDNQLVKIDANSFTVLEASIDLSGANINNNFIVGNKYAVVSSNKESQGEVVIIDVEKEEIINALKIEGLIYGLDYSSNKIYITTENNKIQIIDLTDLSSQEIVSGQSPRSVKYFTSSQNFSGVSSFRKVLMWVVIVILVIVLLMRARKKRKSYDFEIGTSSAKMKKRVAEKKQERASVALKKEKVVEREKTVVLKKDDKIVDSKKKGIRVQKKQSTEIPRAEKRTETKSIEKSLINKPIERKEEPKETKKNPEKKEPDKKVIKKPESGKKKPAPKKEFVDVTDEFLSKKRKTPETSILDMAPEEVEDAMLKGTDDASSIPEVNIEYDLDIDLDDEKY